MMNRIRRHAASAAVLALAFAGAIAAAPSATAVPNTIPLTITNNSGKSDVRIYVLGQSASNPDVQGYFRANGQFVPWAHTGQVPVEIPDADIRIGGPAPGQSTTITLSRMSGRIYFSYGAPLKFFRVNDGKLVQPSLSNSADPNWNVDFNWSELTFNGDGIWINSTQVDMFASPYQVGTRNSGGQIKSTGRLKDNGFGAVVNAINSVGYGNSIVYRGSQVLRVLAPSHAIGAGRLPSNLLDGYIHSAWDHYKSRDLVMVPWAHEPNNRFYGRVGADNIMRVRNGSGNQIAEFRRPSTDAVFGCHKELDAVNSTQGVIARTLCSDLNRSVLKDDGTHPLTNPGRYYRDKPTNEYSRIVHEQMVNGKAYGFAFDDVVEQESLVHEPDVTQAYMNLDPIGGSAPAIGGGNGGGGGGGGSLPTGTSEIRVDGRSLCLDIPWADHTDGNRLQIANCNGNTQAQRWTRTSEREIRIGSKCVDVRSSGTTNGTIVVLWNCNGTGAQKWEYNASAKTLRNPNSGKCLDVKDGFANPQDGQQLQIWDCFGDVNQRWTF